VLLAGKGETALSTLMERLRGRSVHQASWMETVKVLNTSLSSVSNATFSLVFSSHQSVLRRCHLQFIAEILRASSAVLYIVINGGFTVAF